MSVRQPPEAWRSLRRRRATPPGSATDSSDRRATFSSALEQFEQQFRAATSVDYDSRALNLYYGISQAGRAVAAAATSLGQNDWTLRGHGLRCLNLDSVTTDVDTVGVKPHGKPNTSFQRLSLALSSSLPESATLGDLWPMMYETTLHAPLGDIAHPPLNVHLNERLGVGAHGIDSVSIELPGGVTDTSVEKRVSLTDFLARYPALAGWCPQTPTGAEVTWPTHDEALGLQWHLTNLQARSGHVVGERLIRYRNHRMAFPVVARTTAPMHPLMAWWAVLYALSMLTRYQPAQWTAIIDVNRSKQATAIEFVLDTALAVVPDLLDEAIDLVAKRTGPPVA